jgi:hypothetical protein
MAAATGPKISIVLLILCLSSVLQSCSGQLIVFPNDDRLSSTTTDSTGQEVPKSNLGVASLVFSSSQNHIGILTSLAHAQTNTSYEEQNR